MRKTLFAAAICLCPYSQAFSNEVEIGHLETNDDAGINWIYFRCQTQDSDVMYCGMFRTTVSKSVTDKKKAAEDLSKAQSDPLNEFHRALGDMGKADCAKMIAMSSIYDKIVASGLDLAGKPVNKRLLFASKATNDIAQFCRKPDKDHALLVLENIIQQELSTCHFSDFYSFRTFNWHAETNSWASQNGPNGDCGEVSVGTLSHDSDNKWIFTETILQTNPAGTAKGTGQSCKLLPTHTFNYKQNTNPTSENCQYIEHEMQ